MAAAKLMVDHIHPKLPQHNADQNTYLLGDICGHNVVIACLPSGIYGTTSAALVANQLLATFPAIRYGLMVGIGGGVPDRQPGIMLGDIIVSKPTETFNGVVQYDLGKTVAGGNFERTGALRKPPQALLTAVSHLHSNHLIGLRRIPRILEEVFTKMAGESSLDFQFPGRQNDRLFDATYDHESGNLDCSACNPEKLIENRPDHEKYDPHIYYGLIASGNQVIKHGETRARLARELPILCFEMEAAGLMDHFPCLVIRGICDYADSHKQKQWQGYAAVTASAYAKELLSETPVSQTQAGSITNRQASAVSRRCMSMIPFERNTRFVGRKSQLQQLESMIFTEGQSKKAAIMGLGGVGKTQIALEFAYRVCDKYPECSIFWIQATSLETVEQGYMAICRHLGMEDVKPQDIKQQVQSYLSKSTTRWLLVVDNADDTDMWMSPTSGDENPLKDYLPHGPEGFTLFTTRDRQVATKLAGADVLIANEMTPVTANHLFRASLIQKDLVDDENRTAVLLEHLCYLPLAIVQAASYINENDISLATYISLLNEQESGIVELLSCDFEDEWRYADVKNPVAATWLISFQQIRKINQTAAEYLSMMSCIHHRDIPQPFLPIKGISRVKQQTALGVLKAYSFITVHRGNEFIDMHRLVHLASRNHLRNGDALGGWVLKAGTRMNEVFPTNDNDNRNIWRGFFPHALSIFQDRELQSWSEDLLQLAERLASCLYSDGRYSEAQSLCQRLIDERKESIPLNDERAVRVDTLMANIYWQQGRWKECEDLHRRLLDLNKEKLGTDHPDTLDNMSGLAVSYWSQGRWDEARELNLSIIRIRKEVLGPEHPKTLISMNNLAVSYQYKGEWKNAEDLLVQVVDSRKRVLGAEHPQTLTSMSNLALTYRTQQRLTEAEDLQATVMEARKTVLGAEHPDTLVAMNQLGVVYQQQKRWKESEALQLNVIETSKRSLGPEHPDTLTAMNNLAVLYQNQKRASEALELHLEVAQARSRVFGATHPETLISMSSVGQLYFDQNKLKEAEEIQLKVLEVRKKILGREHPSTFLSMERLAKVWKSMGRNVSAVVLLKDCLRLRDKILGPDHPKTKLTRETLDEWQV